MIWDDSYKIGVKEVDKQHQELFKLIVRLENSLTKGAISEITGLAIKELVDYTKVHFKSEETFMKLINYPDFAYHKNLHNELKYVVQNLLTNLKDGKRITTIDLVHLLKKWVENHILQEDLKLQKYFSEYLIANNQKAKSHESESVIEIRIL